VESKQELLLMAIRNLLDNAVTYGEDPVVVIDEHQISVEDHGPGLPPQVLDRLFTPFNTTKSVGLGLFIAKKACELNNLTLDYKTERTPWRHLYHFFTNSS